MSATDDPTGTVVKLVDLDQDGYWYPEGRRYPTLADLIDAAASAGLDPAIVRVDHAGCDHCGVGVMLFDPAVAVAGSNAAAQRQGSDVRYLWDEERGVWPVARRRAEETGSV